MLHASIKWTSVVLLLAGGLLTRAAGSYEHLLTVTTCLGALAGAFVALRKSEYFLACGLVSVALLFAPVLLVTRVFLLMGFACVVTVIALFAVFRPAGFHGENDFPH